MTVSDGNYAGWEDKEFSRLENVAIKDVCCDARVQPREKLNRAVVLDYRERMQAGESFPALQIVLVDKKYLLVDGYHRLEAAKLAKRTTVRCDVRRGTLRDAILLSSGVNSRHGLRRTVDDKRLAVIKLLVDSEWSQWSDRRIAEQCHVSHPLVGRLRSELRSLTGNVTSETPVRAGAKTRKYTTKHGTPALMRVVARQRSATVTSEPINSLQQWYETGEEDRARLVKAVADLEQIIRATPVAALRIDPVADDALSTRLEEIARLILHTAQALVQRT